MYRPFKRFFRRQALAEAYRAADIENQKREQVSVAARLQRLELLYLIKTRTK